MRNFKSFSKEKRFDEFKKAVQYCSICPRLSKRTKVLSDLNGNINSKVLFIAEAPGRLGADRTGIPLCGDRTGDIFESLISNIGWKREQIFITNTVLCNPRQENGNNGTPTKEEIFNCSLYLGMTIELIDPGVVVPMGKTALEGLTLLYPHFISLKKDIGKIIPWNGRYIFPLYHPGPRALVHRSIIKQRADYMLLAKQIDPLKGRKIKKTKKLSSQLSLLSVNRTPLHEMVLLFVNKFKELSIFKLTKLLYLTDILALEQLGKTLSGEIYLRKQEGPWVPKLNEVLKSIKSSNIEINYKNKIPYIVIGPNPIPESHLDENALSVVLRVIEKYGNMSNAEIKSAAYLTEPMKYILKREKGGRDMRNIPVIYKEKTAIELDNKGDLVKVEEKVTV
ncbi:MAG: hypothetical protein A3G93_02135 [Nitrospinae bacterium RIFCSPLOWO2_12_FULL_45_22]|nr:MAG: hypothetical protein A3G93_02135 [Nitrospinae bacterium RIFCSPLOWO2_12_FULL_45_22]